MSIEGEIGKEVTALTPEIYRDLVKPSAQELGGVAGRSVKALLSPVRAFLWSWEKIEEVVVSGVEKRIKTIPESQRKTPDPEIAVPLIQALTYTAQNETLREMYLNLLGNSMNVSMEKTVHPSFVELVKRMNALDAKVFDRVSDEAGYQKIINPNVAVKNERRIFINAMPEWFIGWKIDGYDIFDVSSSLVRLGKLGVIELMFDRTAGDETYEILETHPELIPILDAHKNYHVNLDLEIIATKSILYVNEYGRQFKSACQ